MGISNPQLVGPWMDQFPGATNAPGVTHLTAEPIPMILIANNPLAPEKTKFNKIRLVSLFATPSFQGIIV